MRRSIASLSRVRRYPVPRPALRLVCFPYAGGGVSVFQAWPRSLPPEVEVCTVELPGRGVLLGQPPLTSAREAVEWVLPSLEQLDDAPLVLYGHSMGALLSFEIARALRRRGAPLPRALCVSGHRAPQLRDPRRKIYHLPEPEFLVELRRLEGTPPEVLENRELMELILPMLRADFTLCETYEYAEEPPLEIPIHAWGGVDDREVAEQEVAAWRHQTTAGFTLRMLPGTHFFVHSSAWLLLQDLNDVVRKCESAKVRE